MCVWWFNQQQQNACDITSRKETEQQLQRDFHVENFFLSVLRDCMAANVGTRQLNSE